ncbi:MAG: type II toxin-antitoxin system HicB family antitoxin [Eubacterium sp.]|nr:type II toxin-antitoxin system HicB family antitoxin [Eubacterium sp.]
MRFYYPAIVTKKTDGSYHADFPDLEMCEADGYNEDDCLDKAKDALYSWIDVELQEEGEPDLPPASDIEELEKGLGENQFVRTVMIIYRILEGWEE